MPRIRECVGSVSVYTAMVMFRCAAGASVPASKGEVKAHHPREILEALGPYLDWDAEDSDAMERLKAFDQAQPVRWRHLAETVAAVSEPEIPVAFTPAAWEWLKVELQRVQLSGKESLLYDVYHRDLSGVEERKTKTITPGAEPGDTSEQGDDGDTPPPA